MAFLELNGLSKSYGAQVAVNAIDLAIEKGQLVCLLGPSGCGKTTTLRLIAGFIQPSAGVIRLAGQPISSASAVTPPERRNMSMIFQSYALWPHMSVFDNVAYGLRLRRISRQEVQSRAMRMLEATRLSHLAQRYPGELSGGQQQRVSLARALVVEPETLLLDEPLSNLDHNLREEMRFEIRRLHDEFRYTTVYVTHDQTEAMTAADVVVVMNRGQVEQAGSPEDVYERPTTVFAAKFLGGTNIFSGRKIAADTVDCGEGLILRCGGGAFAAQGDTHVSIRQHDIELMTAAPQDRATNCIQGHVVRQVYLGSHRDYLVVLAGGRQVRAVAPASVCVPQGAEIFLHLPIERCRALAN